MVLACRQSGQEWQKNTRKSFCITFLALPSFIEFPNTVTQCLEEQRNEHWRTFAILLQIFKRRERVELPESFV